MAVNLRDDQWVRDRLSDDVSPWTIIASLVDRGWLQPEAKKMVWNMKEKIQAEPDTRKLWVLPGPAENSPRGMGGWLLLFVIGWCFLGPLASLGNWSSALVDNAVVYDALRELPFGSIYLGYTNFLVWCGLLLIPLGILLVNGHPSAPRVAQILLLGWAGAFVMLTVLAILVSAGQGVDMAILLGRIGAALVWFAYFRRSKRVRNTFAATNTTVERVSQ